ncbi:MAG TPA: hypothetical protein PLS49_03755 [Candidatus Woesebacteria bacterium]|nr:hypothetical protein [Candidatus Woesebacteria bacterium]
MSKKNKLVCFTEEELKLLMRYQNSRTEPFIYVLRAKILVSLHNKEKPADIVEKHHTNLSAVARMKRKFVECSKIPKIDIIALLRDRPRSGRPVTYKIEEQNEILATICKEPKEFNLAGTTWTYRRLKNFLNKEERFKRLSISYISKLNHKRKIVPHKVRYFLTSKDPRFAEKKENICKIYKSLRDGTMTNKVVISVDEKTHITAHKNIREDIPAPLDKSGLTKKKFMKLRDPEYRKRGEY